VQDISSRTGFSQEKVKQLLQLNPEVCSLDIPTGDREDGTLSAIVEDLQALQPQEELVRRELEQILEDLLGTLNDRQQQILRMHFGMTDGICYSLEEIGRELGISKERARQIERQAMDKLFKLGTSMGLEDFLE
jgi:RNA polymerase primary sigma factor